MPIVPDSPSVSPYMQAVASVTELVFKLAGFYGEGNQINGGDQLTLVQEIALEMDKLLKNNLYDIFYSGYKGALNGLNIRYREFKGTSEEKQWLTDIVKDSANLVGDVIQQLETELRNEHEHTLVTLGLYADVCLFRANAMTTRKIIYGFNGDQDVKVMLQECKGKQDIIIEKVQQIYDKKNADAENCVEPEPQAGTIRVPICKPLRDSAQMIETILLGAKQQRRDIEKTISVIPQ